MSTTQTQNPNNTQIKNNNAAVRNPDPWALPDLPLHKPDCSAITDDEIRRNILGKWAAGDDGNVKIPYTYGGESYYKLFGVAGLKDIVRYHPKPLDETGGKEYINNIKENIEQALLAWEKAGKGKIEFVHQIHMDKNTPGISFYLGDEKALDKNRILGYTLFGDHNDTFNNVAIVYRDSKSFWDFKNLSQEQLARNIRTVVHEIGHGHGEPHYFDDPEILAKLQKTKDGVFCSVMPYQFIIQTPENTCHGDRCNPAHATLPGPLDERYLSINYNINTEGVCDNNSFANDKIRMLSSSVNILNNFANAILLGATQKTIHEFITNLHSDHDEKLFSEMKANLLSDICFVAAMIAAKRSPYEINTYLINAAMKYVPESSSDKIPSPIKAALTSPYTGVALAAASIAWSAYQGNGFLPIFCEISAGTYADKIGSFVGEKAARGINYLHTKLGEALLAYWPISEAETDTDLIDAQDNSQQGKLQDETTHVQEADGGKEVEVLEDKRDAESDEKKSSFLTAGQSTKSMFTNTFNMFKQKTADPQQTTGEQKALEESSCVQENIASLSCA